VTRSRSRLLFLSAAVALLTVSCTSSGAEEPERTTEAFCASLSGLSDLDKDINQLQLDLMADAVDQLGDLQAVAPLEIEAEVGVLAEYLDAVVEGYGAMDPDAINSDPGTPFRGLEEHRERVETAGTALELHAMDTCGLDLRAIATVVAPPLTTPENPDLDGTEPPAD
jgi:hypothetical protein